MADADRTQGTLPAEPTRLVGRRAELAGLSALSERSRLVTVTGVGGVGKTRLALRAAAEARPRFADGAYWVSLSGIDDGAALAFAIAEALPLHDQSVRSMIDVVADYLAGRELLLVLDTCEHLVDECAIAVAALLAAAPGLRILATSRRPLGLDAELTFTLEPFPVTGQGPAAGDAVALLAERAAAVAPGLEAEVAGDKAARLCRRLDGLPLAIELAAARLAEMPIGELIDRLDDRFALLGDDAATDAGADAAAVADPPWHQALRTAIGWSHELCSAPERLLWARLSVFAGGFDAGAAVRVCADDRLPAAEIPGLLAALAEKSVLIVVPQEPVNRFRMLDTIREYGAFWLRGLGEDHTLRCRHRDNFLEMAREGDAGWLGPDQVAWYRRVTTEHDNLRAALDFSLAEPESLVALELAGALWFMWYPYGFLKEGRRYLELALAADERPSVPRNRAQWALGLVMISMGDPDGVQEAGERCASGAESADDPQAAAHARTLWVGAAILRGDLRSVMTRAEAIMADSAGGPISLPVLLPTLMRGIALLQLGHADDAVRGLAELRAICERAGEHWMRAYGDVFRAQAELVRGDPGAAARYATAAVRAKRWLHDHTGIAISVDVLGTAASALGQSERTARLLGLSQQVWESVGVPQAGVPEWVATREACEDRARRELGDAAYEAAFDDGYRVAMDDGIDQLIEEPIAVLPNGTP